jgi:transposase
MKGIYYIGLDVHKRTIAFCVKTAEGRIVKQGSVKATREALRAWVDSFDRPWIGAMEATIFTGWIYDFLRPFAQDVKVAHPKMLKAIACAKKKNDRVDARKLADLLRCDLLPECHMASPEIRELRRVLRFRNLLVRQGVRLRNRMAGLLMEVGEDYDKKKLGGKRYFEALVGRLEDVPRSVVELLKMSRGAYDLFERSQKMLVRALRTHKHLRERVELLMSIGGVGEVGALTWALEIGDPARFSSQGKAMSYCGLTSAQRESAGKQSRGPLSKDRNKHLQTILIEAAKIAPLWNAELARVHDRELKRGNRNQATIAVARKMVGYLLAVDRRRTAFEPMVTCERTPAANQAA